MEIPPSLTEQQIRSLTGEPDFLKAIIADREQRLAKARGIFVEQRKRLELLAELQQFQAMMEDQCRRIEKMIDDGFHEPQPDDVKLVKTVQAVMDRCEIERGKRAKLQSIVDRVRLVWTAGTIDKNAAESVAWAAILDELRKEVSGEQQPSTDGAGTPF